MIEIENLTYKNILKNINLKIPKGINYIKGKNGSGKSTLLDCLSGINRDYRGKIISNKSIIYLNQNIYFSYRLTSKDFISFIFTIEGIKEYKENFFNYIKKYGLTEDFEKIWNTQVGMLSKGERTKLFFTAICFIERDWYIFDEPFAGIDKEGKEYMVKVIGKLNENKKGIIITSHEDMPLNYFNNINVISIDNGQIVSE